MALIKNDECTGEESTAGSWEAGKNGAKPGLIMPGTPLEGARYFQEIAANDNAVDRGEIGDVGFKKDGRSGCIEINDTNPSEGVCEAGEDLKIYCPGVGLVQDQDLELVEYGFVDCDDDDDDSDDDDDDDDDDDHHKRKRWGRR